jgi:hypothetical protein
MPRHRRTARLAVRLAAGAALLGAALYAAVYWVEAEKEVRILCGLSRPGTPAAEIDRLYGTATLLTLARDSVAGASTLRASSARNLRVNVCTVRLAGGVVTDSAYEETLRLASPATVVSLLALGGLALLQLLLAAGAPLGRLAWGGAHERLPSRLRAASAAVAVVCLVGMASVAILAEWIAWPAAGPVAEAVVGVLTVVFLLSYLANLASSSARERWLGVPLALLLVVSGVVLLLGS